MIVIIESIKSDDKVISTSAASFEAAEKPLIKVMLDSNITEIKHKIRRSYNVGYIKC